MLCCKLSYLHCERKILFIFCWGLLFRVGNYWELVKELLVDTPFVEHMGDRAHCCQIALHEFSIFLSNIEHMLFKWVTKDKAVWACINIKNFRMNSWCTTSGSYDFQLDKLEGKLASGCCSASYIYKIGFFFWKG